MHFTPRPRWLMIVSTAMVVLPVLRSPMISSRWPSPTGTDRMRPVALTVWPSLTPEASPSTTQPIESSSRLRARPTAPLSNSSSSLTAASGSPATVAMPSPTSVMRPTCAVETSGLKSSRFLRSAAAMSAVLMVSSAIGLVLVLLSSECVLQLVEPAADRSVDHGVADLGDDAAEHRRVDDDLLAAGCGDARIGEGLAQLVVALQGLREAEQLVLDLTEGALGPGHAEEGLGVGERAVDCHLGVLLVGLLGRGAAVRPHERCAAIWLM